MRKPSTASIAATTLALIASAFTVAQVQAQSAPPMVPTQALEDAVETTTEDVLLPTSVPGTITFRNCAEPCKVRSLMVTERSTFLVGETPVALADFNAFLRSTGRKPLTVLYQVNGTDVTRVLVVGQLSDIKQTKPTLQIKRSK